ncbi:STAS domain-containing protein [Haloechinothrix halophila]|uniref:STAS domain-containing protein n=1 Tax=Haloechinothrix halophila TaxID=1069073 RepID=UPI0004256A0D|nr:STAS domain-containing protein [Haloechinothrix halophila]
MTPIDYGMSPHTGSIEVVKRQLDSGAILVTAAGEIDSHTHADLKTALVDALTPPAPAVLIADLSDVSFFDSSGVATMVDTHQRAQAAGTDFRIVCHQRAVRRPLTITSVDRYLNLYDARESAYHQPNSLPLTSP